jgi:hypothetical protein
MARRAKPGDVLVVTAPDGAVVYLHYLGKHQEYGDGVAVCPAKQVTYVDANAELFRGSYVTFFPVVAAVAQGLASVVGHLPSPGLPKRVRRPGARSASKVETWIIEDGSVEVVKRELSDAERKLPIAVIWNRDLLVQRVSEGWRPEMEGRSE